MHLGLRAVICGNPQGANPIQGDFPGSGNEPAGVCPQQVCFRAVTAASHERGRDLDQQAPCGRRGDGGGRKAVLGAGQVLGGRPRESCWLTFPCLLTRNHLSARRASKSPPKGKELSFAAEAD